MEGRIEEEVLCLKGTNLEVGDFVWAENERPQSCVEQGSSHEELLCSSFPDLDFSLSNEELIPLLQSAAASWGFFRVFNHGVPLALLNSISAHSLRFFNLPLCDKLAVSREPPALLMGYTSIVRSSVVKAWAETLHILPGEDRICGLFDRVPSPPDWASFCADMIEYFNLVGALALRIIHLLFRDLDVDEATIFDNIDSSSVRINYYPACPVADLTYGTPPHKDFGGLTILHQDDVGGLEVFKDGHWFGVKPEKGYLTVNVGDIFEVLSNSRYKSVLHRSLVHSAQPRLSSVFFFYPPEESRIAPLSKFVTKDSPPKYKPFYLEEYRSMFAKAQKGNHSASLFFEENS